MTTAEKIEIGIIAVIGFCTWFMAPGLPGRVTGGGLLLSSSALLVAQGLVRDLWLLAQFKAGDSQRTAQCMCAESTLGILGIVFGLGLLFSPIELLVTMSPWLWSALVCLSMGIGFAIKDFVLEWWPLRVRRDKDHINIIFKIKR